jgi:hypothetical protein
MLEGTVFRKRDSVEWPLPEVQSHVTREGLAMDVPAVLLSFTATHSIAGLDVDLTILIHARKP